MVGTHFPDDRDVVESALQRMREAFEALYRRRFSFLMPDRGLVVEAVSVEAVSRAIATGAPDQFSSFASRVMSPAGTKPRPGT